MPPGRLVGPQPVMPETVRLCPAEVEQFRFVCYRTKGVFHRMDRLLRRVAALLDGLHFTTTPQALRRVSRL